MSDNPAVLDSVVFDTSHLGAVADLWAHQLLGAAVRKRTDGPSGRVQKGAKRCYFVYVGSAWLVSANRTTGLVPGFGDLYFGYQIC